MPSSGIDEMVVVTRRPVFAVLPGAECIPAELKGMTSAMYLLLGPVDVLLRKEQLSLAREMLLADAVDAVFDGLADGTSQEPPGFGAAPTRAGRLGRRRSARRSIPERAGARQMGGGASSSCSPRFSSQPCSSRVPS